MKWTNKGKEFEYYKDQVYGRKTVLIYGIDDELSEIFGRIAFLKPYGLEILFFDDQMGGEIC